MSFAAMATVSCSTKRSPSEALGKFGPPAENVTGLTCLPLDPLDPELRNTLQIQVPHEALQTFIQGDPDIIEGDFLTVSGTDYAIRAVEDWVWRDDVFLVLVLVEDKT